MFEKKQPKKPIGVFEKKYGNVLTVFLVILAIVILAGLGYIVFYIVTGQSVKNDAADEAQKFRESTREVLGRSTGGSDANIAFLNEETAEKAVQTDKRKYYKGFEMIGTIEIPKTKVDYPILLENSAAALKVAITLMWPNKDRNCLNQPGNVVLAGHNYKNGTFFSNNKQLSKGDKVYITDLSGNRKGYTIKEKAELSPEEFSFAVADTKGKAILYLSTCTDDTQNRTVIKCVMDK